MEAGYPNDDEPTMKESIVKKGLAFRFESEQAHVTHLLESGSNPRAAEKLPTAESTDLEYQAELAVVPATAFQENFIEEILLLYIHHWNLRSLGERGKEERKNIF